MKYAEVIIDVTAESLDRPFLYRIPPALEEAVTEGAQVVVPFGRGNRRVRAFVIALTEEATLAEELIKDIEEVVTGEETAEARLIDLAVWMSHTYGGVLAQSLKTVFPLRKKIKSRTKESALFDFSDVAAQEVLSEEQRQAVDLIRQEWAGDDRPVLINGVTGSGKTLVYMELIAETLARGAQVIVLIPEIALTRQTVARFYARFGDAVSFMHSRLSGGERYDQMKAAREGTVSVMVGPRSALFTPFPNLGLIIIDEEQESTYISESTPRYHACETAIERAGREGAHVVFGSATPSLWASAKAEAGIFAQVCLRERYGDAKLPDVSIVDLRAVRQAGDDEIISATLANAISDCLERNEQVMLFLNRRGYAGGVSCRACGEPVKCPHCDVSLTLHQNGKLICHYCGHEQAMPKACPACGDSHISGMSVGTQQVERLCKKRFPDARILRMDMDSTRGKEGHAEILSAFEKQEADILIGTQMIVKGHDFGNVTLVGILLADLSLAAPDFRAAERTYQLIVQAIGRAGRADKEGRAIIQTWQGDHPAILAAAKQDYDAFYREEMSYRRMMHYPPAGEMLAVLAACNSEETLSVGMRYLRQLIDKLDPAQKLRAIGPAPQSVGKVRDAYRQVIYLRHKDRDALIAVKDRLEAYIRANKGFDTMRIEFDLHA